jgi:osmotically-inducible protein OsmY
MKTDSQLRTDVEVELEWDPTVNNSGILVAAKDGVVTLGGNVPAYADRWNAEKAAKNIAGVQAIANEIAVKPATPRSDQDVAAAALNALKSHVAVPASNIKVIVSDGWVTLEGNAQYWHQRVAAEDAIRSLWGVRGIHNSIHIRPAVIAGEIASKIRAAFERHADLDADKVHVTVLDGTVTLTGEVHSWHEREDAENAARAAPGVRGIKNDLSLSS